MNIFKTIMAVVALTLLLIFSPAARSEPAAPPSIDVRFVTSGITQPTGITSTGIFNDDRLFILEKTGQIKILKDGAIQATPFLNLEGQVNTFNERGLLGLAFDPNYEQNGYFYINYSDARAETEGDTIVKRFTVSNNPDVADPDSGFTIIEIEQDFANHNGGWLAFDKDGQLVIGMGDGGSGGDPNNRAQSKDTLLGKMIRINVHDSGLIPNAGCGRVQNYRIPEDNPRPFGEDDWCPEIWSYGWRNPWRFSFDQQTGDMWAGDVGQNGYEEINFEAYGTANLPNYGWVCYEGFATYSPANCSIPENERVDPVADYDHTEGVSVTGGYVYRGSNFPAMNGHYIYGDFANGQLWSIEKDNDFEVTVQADTDLMISAFGEATDGSMYAADFSGRIYEVISEIGARVELSVSGLTVVDGELLFDLTVHNIGTSSLNGVQLQSQVPSGVTYSSGGVESGGVVRFDVGTVPAGESRTVRWTGTADALGTITADSLSITSSEITTPISNSEVAQAKVVDAVETIYLPVAIR